MKKRNKTKPASVSDTQPVSVKAGKSLILRVYDYIERMERFGWIFTRHRDGLDRYGYLPENGLYKSIFFSQLVDYCNSNLSMSDVAACCSILPPSDELYRGNPPANHPAGVMPLESQNVESPVEP